MELSKNKIDKAGYILSSWGSDLMEAPKMQLLEKIDNVQKVNLRIQLCK